jgi:hypothetical protein
VVLLLVSFVVLLALGALSRRGERHHG